MLKAKKLPSPFFQKTFDLNVSLEAANAHANCGDLDLTAASLNEADRIYKAIISEIEKTVLDIC